jgi:DNA repair protein RecN (Recombination protein N)
MAMLEELHIQNFAIIDDLKVQFRPGLNVLTGETGTGKSILIGAIQLLLGGKAVPDLIRQGTEEAVVEGLFGLSASHREALTSLGFAVSDQVILRRVISRSGRSRGYVNGQFCTLQMLADLGQSWVNIYGQHEHQLLLQPERNLDLLDAYGASGSLRENWEEVWKHWGQLKGDIQRAEARSKEAEAMKDLWEFQCAEIEGTNLVPGEEEALEQERKVLYHAHRIQEGLDRAEDALYGQRGSALERSQLVLRELEELKRIDEGLNEMVDILSEVTVSLEEAVRRVRDHRRRVEVDPGRLQEMEERLAEIQRMKRKYKGNIPEILHLADDLRSRLKELEQGEETLEDLLHQEVGLREAMLKQGLRLREARKNAGGSLSESVERELRDLGIDRPIFRVNISPLQDGEPLGDSDSRAGNRGMDQVEFLLSTNIGERPRPLSRIASGGELSRIMLALKRVLADAEQIPTLIFDEIDAGIGGAVAQVLGEKLNHIAKAHQVLCITHLPQIACFANNHIKVSKTVRAKRATTQVEPLDEEQRVEEISRMLGGKEITERTRDHARELLQGILK